jgi:hypothetical protein
MPLTKEQLRKCLAGARNVIQKDAESEQQFAPAPQRQQMREQSGQRGQRGYNASSVSYVDTDTELDYESPYGVDESYEEDGLDMPSDIGSAARNSRMPDAIKKSMMQEQIDVSALQTEGSVLDSLGMQGGRRTQRAQVNEARRQTSGAGINYNLIKQIINDCLDERLGDNSLKTIQVGDGKIRLVDNQGRIFIANLEYKGNIADKKKK